VGEVCLLTVYGEELMVFGLGLGGRMRMTDKISANLILILPPHPTYDEPGC